MAYCSFTPNNENHELIYCPVENNSWDFDENGIKFRGRPASSMEKKTYNLQKGVLNNNVSLYIYSTNLPSEIKPDDKVKYLGKIWVVQSVGYYLEKSLIMDSGIFDPEYIKARCGKGLTLV